jgi:predicted SnoaL-like aldol condensation-catalyzing enzyme
VWEKHREIKKGMPPMSESVGSLAIRRYEPPTAEQLQAATSLVARFAARWEKPDADSLRDLMHPDTQNLIPPMKVPADREGVVEHFRQVLKQLPDMRIDVVRWAPTADHVMVEWEAHATVAGESMSWTGVDRFRIRGDRMVEACVYWDTRGLAERMSAAISRAQGAR